MTAAQKSLTAAATKASTGTPGSALVTGATAPENPFVEIVSREVIRIKIPSGAITTKVLDADGKTPKLYVEVYVATPNGISNRLLIPVKESKPAKADAPKVTGYSVAPDSLTLKYTGHFRPNPKGGIEATDLRLAETNSPASKTLTITPESTTGFVPRCQCRIQDHPSWPEVPGELQRDRSRFHRGRARKICAQGPGVREFRKQTR